MVANIQFRRKSLLSISSHSPMYVSKTPQIPMCGDNRRDLVILGSPYDGFHKPCQNVRTKISKLTCLLFYNTQALFQEWLHYTTLSPSKKKKKCTSRGGCLCSEFRIFWAFTETLSWVPDWPSSYPSFLAADCLKTKALHPSKAARYFPGWVLIQAKHP